MAKNNSSSDPCPFENHKLRIKKYFKKIRKGMKQLKVGPDDVNVISALAGDGARSERMLWSDGKARYRAAKIFAEDLRAHRAAAPTGRQYFMVTAFDDLGVTSDRQPVVPLDPLYEKLYRSLRSLKLSAFVVTEVHPLMNHPGKGRGRSLLFHHHAVAWSDGPFDHRLAEAQLNRSRAWTCSLGAKPINIKPIDDSPTDFDRVACYLFKPPHSAKNAMPDKKHPERMLLMDTVKGYRPELALRVLEGLGQVDLLDAVFGVNDGASLRQLFRTRMEDWHRNRSKSPDGTLLPADFDTWSFWATLRQTNGSKEYFPYRFVGGSPSPKPERAKAPSSRTRVPKTPSRPKPTSQLSKTSIARRRAAMKAACKRAARRPMHD